MPALEEPTDIVVCPFTVIWNSSGTLLEAAQRLGLTKSQISNIAKRKRAKGIQLKKMPYPANRKTVDPDERFWGYVKKGEPNDCWIWTGCRNLNGYGVFTLRHKKYGAHRYSLLGIESKTEERHVLHSCDNPPCVNPKHLRLGTPAENNRDMHERGRRFYSPLLSEKQAREILRLRNEGISFMKIAERVGVSSGTAWSLAKGKIKVWRHLLSEVSND